MPHFGLMDENDMTEGDAALQRARLHLRSARRQLRQVKFAAGITTLYDALVSAMRWHFAVPELRSKLIIRGNEDLENDKTIFMILVRSGVLDGSFPVTMFETLEDQALSVETPQFDCQDMLEKIENLMTQLGVLPFDEKELPPETPTAFWI